MKLKIVYLLASYGILTTNAFAHVGSHESKSPIELSLHLIFEHWYISLPLATLVAFATWHRLRSPRHVPSRAQKSRSESDFQK